MTTMLLVSIFLIGRPGKAHSRVQYQHPLLCAPRAQVRATLALDSRMWRASGVNPAHMSRKCNAQKFRTMCVMEPAYIMQMTVPRTCRARSAQHGMLLLDSSVSDNDYQ
jgi:hypothetical protein